MRHIKRPGRGREERRDFYSQPEMSMVLGASGITSLSIPTSGHVRNHRGSFLKFRDAARGRGEDGGERVGNNI